MTAEPDRRRRSDRGKAKPLDYQPTIGILLLSVATVGIYPYFWFASNRWAFNEFSRDYRLNDAALRLYMGVGISVQAVAAAALLAWSVELAMPDSALSSLLPRAGLFRTYAFLYAIAVLPLRVPAFFWIRWNLRAAAFEWDPSGLISSRALRSWLKLFLFGTLYVQHHVNRLVGVGMPGLADRLDLQEKGVGGSAIMDYLRNSDSRSLGDRGRR